MNNEVRIGSFAGFVDVVCTYNAKVQNASKRKEFELLFRGQSNKDYPLIPSIGRNRNSSVNYSILNHERNLIELAKYKMPDVFKEDLNPIELLALLQHHGIPTRLLDVTENALVALYFACSGCPDEDGEVIVFEHDNSDVANYPVLNAIADSYRFANYTYIDLAVFYSDVARQSYFSEQDPRADVYPDSDLQGGQWIKEVCNELLYIYAPIRSIRQQLQRGRYILFPNKITTRSDRDCFEKIICPIPKDHQDISIRLIIPKELKTQLLMDLSVMGISEDYLFADNTDIVCKGIVEMFQKRL